MYDKIKIKLYDLPDGYSWRNVLNSERVKDVLYRKDGTGGFGKWHDKTIVATEGYVSFEGSLPKCLYNHNLKTLNLEEVRRLILDLSRDLGVPMYKAIVESLEFAHNFEMKEPPYLYFRDLRGIKGYSNNNWKETIYIENSNFRCKFYDKIKEAKKKRELPKYGKENLPKNLLRYELTVNNKGIKKLFGRDICVEELWDKYVFWKLVAEWFGHYEDIDKVTDDCWDVEFDTLKSAKDFDKWCICIANEGQNLSYYMKYILFKNRKNRLPEDRILHTQFQKRIQEAIKWQKEHFKTSNLMEELTSKIEKYLVWLLEQSADGMSIAEEHRIFSTAC